MNDDKTEIKEKAEGAETPAPGAPSPEPKKRRKVSRWISVPLKTLMWIVIVVLLIPVALYIPPVQKWAKDIACSYVKDSTGMDISIDRLLLRFPLDLSLDGVSVVEATGDTMVRARQVIADVRLLPLLHLDVDVQALSLRDGYYRMVSADSSMIMKIRAARLDVTKGSRVEIAKSNILLDKATIADGDVQLYMNVWKQKPTPQDTTSTPFYISLRQLDVKNIRFGMSMLPTIDTLSLDVCDLKLHDGVIDLRKNRINASLLAISGGGARYIAPTPQYVAAHPVPAPDTTATPSAPFTITADSVAVADFAAIYAMKGARPLPGFDPSYIEVKDVNIGLKNFYNRQSSLRLPITHITANERSGLRITSGVGLVALTEAGIRLDGLAIRTPYSDVSATADIPFALMELKPEAPVKASLSARLGLRDVAAFMPDVAPYTAPFPSSAISAVVEADGRLDDVAIRRLDLSMPAVFSFRAAGTARNALDFKRLQAEVEFDGELWNPSPIEKLVGPLPFSVPALTLEGRAGAHGQNYDAEFSLLTAQGDVVGNGRVGLNSEAYNVDVDVRNLNVAHFAADAGIGTVSASLKADGAGFNPTKSGAHTDFDLFISNIVYNKKALRDIKLQGHLAQNDFDINIDSPNPDVNLNGHITGSLSPDEYCAAGNLRIFDLDLKALGLSEETNDGSADVEFDITARPQSWLYDATLDFSRILWHLPTDDISLPDGLQAQFVAEADNVTATLEADGLDIGFRSPRGLEYVVDAFTRTADAATRQIAAKNLDVKEMQALMPEFTLDGEVSGRGVLSEFLRSSGMTLDTVSFRLANDSLIRGNVEARKLLTGSVQLDTISLGLLERNSLLDYKLHIGNRPEGPWGEFAQVNLNGYMGSNRLSAFLTQRNASGLTGYRFGMTAAVADSTVSVHFTPLKATIAYMPWVFNDDNAIDYRFTDMHVTANLKASSNESGILLMTEPLADGGEDLHLNIRNIHVEDFLRMSMLAPPLTAAVDGDVRVSYDGTTLKGQGDIGVRNLVYNKMMVGDFDLALNAGLNFKGETQARAALKIDGKPAMSLSTVLEQQSGALEPKTVDLELTEFPLKVANAFLGPDVARLSGTLNGKMNMTGTLVRPILNGRIECDSVDVYIPMIGSALKFDSSPIAVADNLLTFNRFSIYGANENPLVIDGNVDARDFKAMKFNLTASAGNFQLINNTRKAGSDLYGKMFLNLNADVKGPMSHFDITGNVNLLGTSNFTYQVPLTTAAQLSNTTTQDVVRFVNFSDTTQTAKADSVPHLMAMRVRAGVTVSPGTVVNVVIPNSASGGGKVQLSPSGTLNYFQNFMGDMTLNGQLTLGNGYAKYSVPVVGEKNFVFNPQSYVLFTGNIMNPTLSISATDNMRASVVNSGGNSSMVNFLVKLNISNTLENPKVVFDLSTDDDLSLQNELQSMTPDQRSTQAMNLLITGRYQGAGMKTLQGNVGENMLYSLVESSLNSLASKYVKGVDLSFGIDQYDTSRDGQQGSTTSYSYQLSKSLFSNRFKIVVGGNYSTDASADENLAQNLISDISFEYTLKQTNSLTMLVRLFRHVGFENVLEGEVTETGVGFTMRRRISDLRKLFRVRWGKRKTPVSRDTLPASPAPAPRSEGEEAFREIRDSVKSKEPAASAGVKSQDNR